MSFTLKSGFKSIIYCCVCSLLCAACFLCVPGCKKHPSQVPLPTPDTTNPTPLPTKDLEGQYVWHSTDPLSGDVISDGIIVLGESAIMLSSEARWRVAYGGPSQYYAYSYSNDSEIVYGGSSYGFVYKFKRGVVVWLNGSEQYVGIVGASAKWKPIHEARIALERHWHRKKYYWFYASNSWHDTTVTYPDTLADAFGLYEMTGKKRSGLTFGGADSTTVFYDEYLIQSGPDKLNTPFSIRYYADGDTITMIKRGSPPVNDLTWYTSF